MTEAPQAWVEVPFEVQKPQEDLRVDAFLAKRLHRYSRATVQKMIDDGLVSIAGRVVKASTRVTAGQTVIVRYPKREEPPPPHDRLAVLFEDDWLIAVDKPYGVLSHPTDKIVENAVTTILKRQLGERTLHLCHRLDRETSGVLLLAKDPSTARLMTDAFFDRTVKKEYWALVSGRVEWATKTVDLPLGREGGEIKVRQAAADAESGQPAVTDFERLAVCETLSLVRALPRTGRLHQIRVHLASVGHPILGDKLYTGAGEFYMKAVRKELQAADLETLGAGRQLLHARALSLPHPVTDAPLRVEAPLPEDFHETLARAGLEAPRG